MTGILQGNPDEPGLHIYRLNTEEAEAGAFPRVLDKPVLHKELQASLSYKVKPRLKEKKDMTAPKVRFHGIA